MRARARISLKDGTSVTMRVGEAPLTTLEWDDAEMLDRYPADGYCIAHRVSQGGALEIAVAVYVNAVRALGADDIETSWTEHVFYQELSLRRVFAPGTWTTIDYLED
jgi:hypothetical protein